MKCIVNNDFQKLGNFTFSEIETTNKKTKSQAKIDLKKEFLKEQSDTGISTCLGSMMLIGIISWLLIFYLIDYLI